MKKIISIIVAALMLATLCSVFVMPASAEGETGEASVYLNGEDLFMGETVNFVDAISFVNNAIGSESVEEGQPIVYTIKVHKNIQITGNWEFSSPGINVVIDGKLADGTNATITTVISGSNANTFRFVGEAQYVLKNVNIIGSNPKGCLIQLKNKANLDIVDSNITTTQEAYFTINSMRDDGGKTYVNIIRSTISQLDPQLSEITSSEINTIPNPYSFVNQRGIIGTCNPKDMDHHLVLNVVDSYLKSYSTCIFVNAGSTADIDVKNSTLEVLAHETAGVKTVWASGSSAGKFYLNGYLDDTRNSVCAVQLDPVSNIAAVGTPDNLRDGTYDTITFDAENTMIKYPAGGEAIHQITAYEGVDYTTADPWTLTNQASCPAVPTAVNATKTTELRATSGVTVNYEVGEPNTEVTTPVDEFDYPELGDDTTVAGGDETTPAVDDETTPAADDETTPAADDETTPAADDETTPAADDETTPAADDETTPAADETTTEAPKGDVTTEAPEADDTTAAEEAAGGCAGCGGTGDGAVTTVAAIAIAMAAAVAIIVKKK